MEIVKDLVYYKLTYFMSILKLASCNLQYNNEIFEGENFLL